MRRLLLLLGGLYLAVLFTIMGVGLFVFGIGFSPENVTDYREMMFYLYDQTRRPALIGGGGLLGIAAWRATVHRAAALLLFRLPGAWESWDGRAGESLWQMLRHVGKGAFFLSCGGAALVGLLAVSGEAFETGLWIGGMVGAAWSAHSLWHRWNRPRPNVDELRESEGALGPFADWPSTEEGEETADMRTGFDPSADR